MRNRPIRQPRSGATVVETAIVLGVAILFLFGIYEYGRFVMMRNLLDNAAREGARYAVVHTADKTTTDVQNETTAYLAGLDARNLSGVVIDVYAADSSGNKITTKTWTDAKFGEYVGVQIDAVYTPVLPSFLAMPATVPLRSTSLMYSEAN